MGKNPPAGGRFYFCENCDSAGTGRPCDIRDKRSLKRATDLRGLTVPYFWILIEADGASFLAISGGPVSGRGEFRDGESLSEITATIDRHPDWRWVGRDFAMAFRKSRAAHWDLTVRDSRPLIVAKNASFAADFRRFVIGVAMSPEMGPPYPRLGAGKSATQAGGGLADTPTVSPGGRWPIFGGELRLIPIPTRG